MNAEQRKVLESVASELRVLDDKVTTVRDENQASYDNLPQGLQDGEKGEGFTAAIEALDNIIQYLEDAESELGGMA